MAEGGWEARLLKSRFGGRLNRVAAFADQGMIGFANILITALLARTLPPLEFASVGVALGIYYFVFTVHRGGVVLPFVLETSADTSAERFARWWRINLGVAAAATLILLAGTGAAALIVSIKPDWAWVSTAFLYAVIIAPFLYCAEFGRRWLYQHRRALVVALSSLVYLAVGLAGAALAAWSRSGLAAAAAWAAAGLAAFMVARLASPPAQASWSEAWAEWRAQAGFAGWQSLTGAVYSAYNTSVVLLVSAASGPAAAAVFTATRTLTNPSASIVAAVDSLDKPRAAAAYARGGIEGLKASVSKTRRLLARSTAAYLAPVALLAPFLLLHVLGPTYAGYALEMRVLALSYFLAALNQPSETFLIVRRASRTLLTVRVVAAAAAIVLITGLGYRYGALGASLALVAVQTLNLAGLALAERRLLREGRGQV